MNPRGRDKLSSIADLWRAVSLGSSLSYKLYLVTQDAETGGLHLNYRTRLGLNKKGKEDEMTGHILPLYIGCERDGLRLEWAQCLTSVS